MSRALADDRSLGWVWGVHLESSTGVLNDLVGLRDVAARAGVRICLDAVSSLGAVPLDLRGVHLATGSSGKALGTTPGGDRLRLAGRRRPGPSPARADVPGPARGAHRARPAVHRPVPIAGGLDRALDDYATPAARADRYAHYAALADGSDRGSGRWGSIRSSGEAAAAPVVTTFAPPPGWSAEEFARRAALGYEIAHASRYLRHRGWVQIATMGELTEDDLKPLFAGLSRPARPARRPEAGDLEQIREEVPSPLEMAT